MKSKIEKLGKVSITVEKDYWDKNKAYNRLTIVERQGTRTAYLSRKVVPIGVDITDRNYWITISKWADIPYEIVQEFGDSTEVVISQKVVTLKVNELQELIDNINEIIGEGGSIDERIATVKSELVDGASEEGDTLKKLEDRLSDVEESVGEGGSVDERIAVETNRAQAAEELLREYISLSQNQVIPKTAEEWAAMTSWEEGVIYRVAGTTSYTDYMYNGTTTIPMATYNNAIDNEPTAGSDNLVKSGGVYKSTPTVANSTAESDLDISDENGNVLVRFANGHIQVKNFSSVDVLESIQAILSNIGFDNVPEFSEEEDYAIGNIVRYEKYVYVFTSAHTAGKWDNTEVEKTVINTEHPVDVETDNSTSDLDISDEQGNVVARFVGGHVKTKHFDSSQIIGEEQMANILTGIQNLNTRVDNVEERVSTPKGIILDTDWWTDVDDAVAIRCLLWAERCGLVDLVGVCVDAVNSTSGKSIAAFLNEEGRGGLAIGMDKQATDYNGNPPYHSTCINNWAYYDNILSNDNCEDCVSFYRRALVNSSKKIDIICIGYGNAIQRLLNSTPDSISPLTGRELVLEKVNKLWWMAGKYPNGSENNFNRTARSRSAGADICTNWPTPIVFLGFEVGETVISGNTLSTDVNSNDLLYKCLVGHGSGNGRSSWDPMTVLLACYDNFDIAGYTTIQGANSVNASTGANTFTVNNQGKHYYVVKKYADWWYAHQINKIISLTSWTSRKLGSQQIDKL